MLKFFVADQCTKRHNKNSQPKCLDVFDKNLHALPPQEPAAPHPDLEAASSNILPKVINLNELIFLLHFPSLGNSLLPLAQRPPSYSTSSIPLNSLETQRI